MGGGAARAGREDVTDRAAAPCKPRVERLATARPGNQIEYARQAAVRAPAAAPCRHRYCRPAEARVPSAPVEVRPPPRLRRADPHRRPALGPTSDRVPLPVES